MINLAPIRYARALEEEGGPLSRLEVLSLETGSGMVYQANAYLSKSLKFRTKMTSVFNQADGCGTSHSPLVARHKAISEALERWALYHLYQDGQHVQSGLDLDSSSAGMAAFPGLCARQSRKRAKSEAIERYALAQWATGQASCRQIKPGMPNVSGIQIHSPFKGYHVVLLWKPFKPKQYAYGFSAARTQSRAINKAGIEMDRMASAMRQLNAQRVMFPVENPMERRILNFTTHTGHQQFLSLVSTSLNKRETKPCPRPVFDNRLKGPWDRFTTVWRVLYPMPEEIYSENPEVFYW